MEDEDYFRLRVNAAWMDGAAIRFFELLPVEGDTLPPVRAGAHINLEITGALVRQYSLANAPGETHR